MSLSDSPPPRMEKDSPPPRRTKATIQPNVYFESMEHIEHWLKWNIPDGRIVKTWVVEKLQCLVETDGLKVVKMPMLCSKTQLPAFETQKDMDKFHESNGHLPMLAKWECRHCRCFHYWSTAPTDTNGGASAGAFTISPYLRRLIDESKKQGGYYMTFER